MSDWFFNLKREMGHKSRDLLDRWRALPKERQWQIAGGLLGVSTLCLAIALYVVFARSSGTNAIEDNTEVVLYSSVDTHVLEPVIQAFSAQTGIKVRVQGDTEATKTTGLVQRLLAERPKPKADVWWSSEPLGTVTLAKEGILDPFVSREEASIKGGWPAHLRPKDKTWYGFAQRARVIAYNTNNYTKATAPARLRDLSKDTYRNRVGMARPQFGTTRTHIAALISLHGEPVVRQWLESLINNGLKLYDGNSSVVHALSIGDIDIGLTDTDDVWAGKRENWPVEVMYEVPDRATRPPARVTGLPSVGPLVIPNTVAKIRGNRHPNEATKLVDFLLSAEVESMLASSDSKNIPIRADLAKKFELTAIPNPAEVDANDVAASLPAADRLINELFPLQ